MNLVISIFLFALSLFAATPACPDFAAGIQAYQNQDYSRASQIWDDCRNAGLQNADLYYNLGNAAYRQGELGKAIWAYESALKLAPTNADIQANLTFVRNQTIDKTEASEEENPVITAIWKLHHLLGINAQLALLLVLAWVASGFLVVLLFVRKLALRNTLYVSLFACAVIGFVVLLDAGAKIYQQETEHIGIVLTKSSDVMSGPGDNYQVLHELHEGTRLEVGEIRGNWANVRIGDNVNGFVKSAQIGVVP